MPFGEQQTYYFKMTDGKQFAGLELGNLSTLPEYLSLPWSVGDGKYIEFDALDYRQIKPEPELFMPPYSLIVGNANRKTYAINFKGQVLNIEVIQLHATDGPMVYFYCNGQVLDVRLALRYPDEKLSSDNAVSTLLHFTFDGKDFVAVGRFDNISANNLEKNGVLFNADEYNGLSEILLVRYPEWMPQQIRLLSRDGMPINLLDTADKYIGIHYVKTTEYHEYNGWRATRLVRDKWSDYAKSQR